MKKENVLDLGYTVECPLCWRKRIVTYHTMASIRNGNNPGYCGVCSNLKFIKGRLARTDIKKKTYSLKCVRCGHDIHVLESYMYRKRKEYGDNFICVDCLIAGRIELRELNRATKATPTTIKLVPLQIEAFGCILKEGRNCRCVLGRKCKHYLECLDKTIELNWDGFTAVGEGHLKDYDWM